ncbi:MAG TPA: hypothetical protein PJ988_23455, partial [Anaerolinea sp.]|nr:hypothetical protein [Anaerolinea sp.]
TPLPSATPSATATPLPASVIQGRLPVMQLYQFPGGPAIGVLRPFQALVVLHQQQIYQGLVWVQVVDVEGRQGWIPEIYLATLTPSPTATASRTPTLMPSPTLSLTPTP